MNWGQIKGGKCKKLEAEIFNSKMVIREMTPTIIQELSTEFMGCLNEQLQRKGKEKNEVSDKYEETEEESEDMGIFGDNYTTEPNRGINEIKGSSSKAYKNSDLEEMRKEMKELKKIMEEGFARILEKMNEKDKVDSNEKV